MKISKKDIWLKEAHSRFVDQGISGININEISNSLGVAKTSFYHFFNSKAEFLEELFKKWEYEGTDIDITNFSKINDPILRFEKVIKNGFTNNMKNEIFLMQLQNFAHIDTTAKKYLNKVKKKRMAFTLKFFTDMGYDNGESKKKAMLWYTYAVGRISNKDNKKFSKKELLSVIEEIKYIIRIENNGG